MATLRGMSPEPVRLSELVATLSLVSDLGMGRPMERVLRQTVIAMRLADDTGVGDEVSAATYYTSLLTWVGCATATSELCELFGDETQLFADSHNLASVSMAQLPRRTRRRDRRTPRRVSIRQPSRP